MPKTYRAILNGNQVEWRGDRPRPDRPLEVDVTVLESPAADRGRAMAEALSELARRNGLGQIEDAGAWERETRRDRPLPGRE